MTRPPLGAAVRSGGAGSFGWRWEAGEAILPGRGAGSGRRLCTQDRTPWAVSGRRATFLLNTNYMRRHLDLARGHTP